MAESHDPFSARNEQATVSELLEEVTRLRRDNASLRELNAALREGNAALKQANTALGQASVAFQLAASLGNGICPSEHECATDPSRSHIAIQTTEDVIGHIGNLPQELLLRIFLATIPPDENYDLSVSAGPRTPWLVSVSTRAALPLVCKAWYGPASEALYLDIALRRMGQISALARTLRSARHVYGSDPSRFIKRVRMIGCVVLGRAADVVEKDLSLVLRYCSNLTALEWHPHPSFDSAITPPDDPDVWYNPMWLLSSKKGSPGATLADRCAAGLQHLAFSENLHSDHLQIHHLLLVSTRLTTLVLGPVLHLPSTSAESSLLPVQLPYLESLEMRNDDAGYEEYICALWSLPNLRKLTLLSSVELPRRLLERLGGRLEYLHVVLGANWRGLAAHDTLVELSTLCPVLKHLVLPEVPTLNLQCTIVSPTLLYLDIWGSLQKRRVVELMCEMGHACGLPSLRAIRMLPVGMAVPHNTQARLPLYCHPEGVRGDEICVKTFAGHRLLQTSWALLPDYLSRRGLRFFGVPCDGDSDSDDGSSYDCAEVDPEEDATSWISDSSAPSTDSGADHSVLEDDHDDRERLAPQYDRDVVLEMFARSQEEDFLFDDD
ncbi:hypothetical protein BV20DRAFT_1025887 [Pilatotrama ljubarskyi]|nr:hypothetical protein BV20DRAFT_1025887 [Pilatotrama ljubarskyi]